MVTTEHVVDRGMLARAMTLAWADVAEVQIGPGPSVLPSTTVLLVARDVERSVSLSALSRDDVC
ncbi:hypothetical protein JOF56_005849 [Kibdelosporangium banguiense]|uniref:Uncharacterized protein n=1 Tax=Kibdelosporangium banguiense TaxID=1365924 RepID=A0ABS4TN86_9PSEU|nr:hypothetical protein [Kibdelosporangium banguiense]MBP2325464.1 hypothetical protein [Kibdelosporangium banguiense]